MESTALFPTVVERPGREQSHDIGPKMRRCRHHSHFSTGRSLLAITPWESTSALRQMETVHAVCAGSEETNSPVDLLKIPGQSISGPTTGVCNCRCDVARKHMIYTVPR
jgi:hypothetical protein